MTTDVADVILWLFFRTRQLNVTCDNLVDREVFLHYSLIPSVSKGSGAQERGHWARSSDGEGREGGRKGVREGGRERTAHTHTNHIWSSYSSLLPHIISFFPIAISVFEGSTYGSPLGIFF